MKKRLTASYNATVTAIIYLLVLASCGDKNLPVIPKPEKPPIPQVPAPPVQVSTKSVQIDSIKKVISTSEFNNIIKDSIWKDSSGISFFIKYKAGSFRVSSENEKVIFPGMFFKAADFANNILTPLKERKSAIRLYSTLLNVEPYDSLIAPSRLAFEGLLNRWFNKPNSNVILNSFISRGEKFNNYSKQFLKFPGTGDSFETIPLSELRPAITQNNITKRTGYFIYTNAIFHAANFEFIYEKMVRDHSFIAQIFYGYEIYIFIESDVEEEKLRPMINRALDGTETATDINSLKQTIARVYYRHPESSLISENNLDGYERIKELKTIIAKPIHNKGISLYFSALDENGEHFAVDRILKMDFLLK